MRAAIERRLEALEAAARATVTNSIETARYLAVERLFASLRVALTPARLPPVRSQDYKFAVIPVFPRESFESEILALDDRIRAEATTNDDDELLSRLNGDDLAVAGKNPKGLIALIAGVYRSVND